GPLVPFVLLFASRRRYAGGGRPSARRIDLVPMKVFPTRGFMAARLLSLALLLFARLAAGAESIVKGDPRETVRRAAPPGIANLAGAVRDSAILWQFDTHG